MKNIIGLCDTCHDEIHGSQDAEDRLKELKEGVRQRYYVGLLNSVIPALIEEVSAYCDEHGVQFMVTDGKGTADTCKKYGFQKDHCTDAYAISLACRNVKAVSVSDRIYEKRRFKKKSGNKVAARNQRVYKYDGKIIAYNRHKAANQKTDSFEEYMAEYAKTHTEKQCRQHVAKIEIIPAERTYTYHKDGLIAPCHVGDIIRYEKHNKIKGNTKTDTFVATSVKMDSEGHIGYGDACGSRKFKFCHPIG